MLYEEYKQIFEEILSLTEKLAEICKKQDEEAAEEFEKVFDERDKLFQKLEPPTDIDQEKLDYICSLRDKIQEKNIYIIRVMEVAKNQIQQAILEAKQETKVVEAYKIPKCDTGASIFDSLE